MARPEPGTVGTRTGKLGWLRLCGRGDLATPADKGAARRGGPAACTTGVHCVTGVVGSGTCRRVLSCRYGTVRRLCDILTLSTFRVTFQHCPYNTAAESSEGQSWDRNERDGLIERRPIERGRDGRGGELWRRESRVRVVGLGMRIAEEQEQMTRNGSAVGADNSADRLNPGHSTTMPGY